jgi:hypothetical protein
MCEKENARSIIGQLFTLLEIKRIVFVDDQYNSKPTAEDIIGLCTEKGLAVCQQIPTFNRISTITTDEIWQTEIRRNWLKLSPDEQLEIYSQLIQQVEDNEDKKSVCLFTEFLNGLVDIIVLSLDDWKVKKSSIINDADTMNTLFLFDQDLSKNGGRENEGYNLVLEVLTIRQGKKTLCGILSHVFTDGQEYEFWYKIKEEYNIDPDQCILISKRRLSLADFLGFAHMVKLTVLNPYSRDLKNEFSELLNNANLKAKEEINQITIYDFEHIVFNSSINEGISELDTLFRINELFFKKNAQRMILEKPTIIDLTNKIRDVSQSCKDTKLPPNLSTWKIQRQELYNEEDYLNKLHLPIELGDIFEKTDSGVKKKFVLLGQPCDLMVRSDGQRNPHVIEGILAEIVQKLPLNGSGYKLLYFNSETGDSYFVNYRKTHNIKLWILDLCAFQIDGQSKISINEECPNLLIPSWKLYYKHLCKYGKKMLEQYEELKGITNNASLLKLILSSSCENLVFNGSLDPMQKNITFKCKRVMRLSQQRANALLSEFLQYCARPAYNTDFGKVS